ncbi:MAG: protein kinase, partial [Acidobacteriota bacterium]
ETDPPTVEAPTPTLGDTPFGETIDRDEAADEISTVRTDKDKGGVAAASAGPPLETDPAIHPESFPRQDDQFRTMVMPILDTAKETSTGENFGEYTLLDRIAIGGMAEVWRARRRGVEGFQKIVAIKKILSHLTGSADFVTMFIDEAKLAAQLNHNNIIQIYDLGKVSEDFFIAMEYVDGKDLRSILTASESAKRPMPVGLGLLVISAVARALDYAHRKRDFEDRALGLVHRDVSPQNVLISYEGEIKLCDFGIVKAVAKASTTQMGALKGKLQYMSPEQAWGKTVDARSDIFSLGSVMYELFTGTKLFAGESEISVLDAVRECRVPSLRESVTDLPEDVERIALKALAKDAGERYQTAGEMEHEIKAVLDTIKPTPSQKDLSAYLQELFAAAEESNGSSAVAGATATAPGNEAPRVEPGAGDSGISPEASPTEAPAAGETGAKPTGSSLLKWLIAALVVGGLIGAGFLYIQSQKAPSQPVPTPTTSTTPAVEQTTPVAPRPASQDEPSADVEGAIESASRDPATSTTESPSADPGESTAAGEPPAPAGTGSLDLEQMVSEELSSRAERLKRDFEEEKKRIEEELAKTRAAEKPVETSENEASEPDAGGDEPEGSAAPPESGGGR